MFDQFEAEAAKAVESGRLSGVVALVTDSVGAVYSHAVGLRAAGTDAAMSPDTIFWLASMTKAVVSVGALQLVDAGKLTLDGDLAHLIPEFADLQVLDGFDDAGTPILRPAKAPVTLRHLLSHTAGFGYGFIQPQIAKWREHSGTGDPASGIRADMVQPLLFDPGEGWAYGINTDWVGVVVEAASGQRLDAYLNDHIFSPLGMKDTGFALSPEQQARKASVHMRGPDGKVMPIPFGMPENPEVLSGGGGLYGPAPDYARFLRMLLNGGRHGDRQILKAETVASLGVVQTGPHRAGAFKAANPAMSNDFDIYPEMHTGYGLATLLNPEPTAEGRSGLSLAWAGLANTYYWADPAVGKAGLIMTQLLPFGDADMLGLLRSLETAAYGG